MLKTFQWIRHLGSFSSILLLNPQDPTIWGLYQIYIYLGGWKFWHVLVRDFSFKVGWPRARAKWWARSESDHWGFGFIRQNSISITHFYKLLLMCRSSTVFVSHKEQTCWLCILPHSGQIFPVGSWHAAPIRSIKHQTLGNGMQNIPEMA